MKSAEPLSTGERSLSKRRMAPVAAPVIEPKLTKLLHTKIIVPKAPSTDPRVIERERLVAQLLAAQGRPAVTRATETLLGAGHELPDTQEAHLQVLEHSDEARQLLQALLGQELSLQGRVLRPSPPPHQPLIRLEKPFPQQKRWQPLRRRPKMSHERYQCPRRERRSPAVPFQVRLPQDYALAASLEERGRLGFRSCWR